MLVVTLYCICLPNTCSLMYDPYKKVVYDYLGAMEDIRKSKVCLY